MIAEKTKSPPRPQAPARTPASSRFLPADGGPDEPQTARDRRLKGFLVSASIATTAIVAFAISRLF